MLFIHQVDCVYLSEQLIADGQVNSELFSDIYEVVLSDMCSSIVQGANFDNVSNLYVSVTLAFYTCSLN